MPETHIIESKYSDEVQDIIGRVPPWVLRNGTIVIFVIICLFLAGARFIKYPDVISAPVILSTVDPPVELVAQETGRIAELVKTDGDLVSKDSIIAVIDNPANTSQVLFCKKIIQGLDTALDLGEAVSKITLSRNVQLGELQPQYAMLYQAVQNYRFFFSNKYYSEKESLLKNQKNYSRRMKDAIRSESESLNTQLKLEDWKDSVNRSLLNQKVISLSEYNEIKRNHLSQRISNAQNNTTLLQNLSQERGYDETNSDLRQQFNTDKKNALLSVTDAVQKFKAEIELWEKKYLFRSPVEGKVSFFKIWKANQYVSSGEPVFMVVPASDQYQIRAQLSVYKAGKILAGQHALIKLQEYPFEEYGMLKATINKITTASLDSSYTIQLKLDSGFTTSLHRKIKSRPVFYGTADIITEEKDLFHRIFEILYSKIYDR